MLNFYKQDWKALYPNSSHRPKNQKAFTYEMSDHLPLWLQVRTDFMDDRLQLLATR